MKKRTFRIMAALLFVGMMVVAIYPGSASTEVLYRYDGPDTSSDGLQLTNFEISGSSPLHVGDEITVKFDLKNTTDKTIYFGEYGILVGCRDPEGRNKDFGYHFKQYNLFAGRTAHFYLTGKKKLDQAGTWTFWPAYYLGSASWVTHRSGWGPYKWHAAKLEAKSAPQSPEKEWTKRKQSTWKKHAKSHMAVALGYFGAQWIPSRGVWELSFRVVGIAEGRGRDKGLSHTHSRIIEEKVIVKEKKNKAHMKFWSSNDPGYKGCWPGKGKVIPKGFLGAISVIAKAAISEIIPFASFPLTAMELAEAMKDWGSKKETSEKIEYTWSDFGVAIVEDSGHLVWFLVDVDPNKTVEFDVKDWVKYYNTYRYHRKFEKAYKELDCVFHVTVTTTEDRVIVTAD